MLQQRVQLVMEPNHGMEHCINQVFWLHCAGAELPLARSAGPMPSRSAAVLKPAVASLVRTVGASGMHTTSWRYAAMACTEEWGQRTKLHLPALAAAHGLAVL